MKRQFLLSTYSMSAFCAISMVSGSLHGGVFAKTRSLSHADRGYPITVHHGESISLSVRSNPTIHECELNVYFQESGKHAFGFNNLKSKTSKGGSFKWVWKDEPSSWTWMNTTGHSQVLIVHGHQKFYPLATIKASYNSFYHRSSISRNEHMRQVFTYRDRWRFCDRKVWHEDVKNTGTLILSYDDHTSAKSFTALTAKIHVGVPQSVASPR